MDGKSPDQAAPAVRPPLDPSFRERAVSFSLAAGCVVFILAMLVGWVSARPGDQSGIRNAIILAIICGATSWAATMRVLAETASAIDRLIARVRAAAHGEVDITLDKRDREELPELVDSIDRLLGRVRSSLAGFHELAMFDPVTGLPNRLHLRREAERRLYSADSTQTRAAMLFIDLDRFKSVNDTLGHQIGDQLLGMVASRLNIVIDSEADSATMTRDHRPIAARLGGDEFTVMVPRSTGEEAVRRLARRVLRALSEPYEVAGHSIEIGASIGIAFSNDQRGGLTTLMRNADLAMYHAKARGRGQVQIYSAELGEQSDSRRQIEGDLRRALALQQFELHLQPQILVSNRQVVSAEALLRWRHPEGLRMPGSFIDVAEESGLIVEIGEWVINAAARMLGDWHARGIGTRIALNVSARQLERGDLFRVLEQAMERGRAPWDLLELEITETALMAEDSEIMEQFERLRRRGVMISIDDFGIGYSNLARLRSLPIDRLKIDRSLIADITHCGEAATISHTIVALAHGLGYSVVAEGVENTLQTEMLRVMGADLMQGYLIARPMPAADFLPWMRQYTADNVAPMIRI